MHFGIEIRGKIVVRINCFCILLLKRGKIVIVSVKKGSYACVDLEIVIVLKCSLCKYICIL